MTIASLAAGVFSWNNNTRNLVSAKSRFNDLQTQLSTNQVSQTYGGLGANRVTALQFQQQLAQVNGYSSTASDVGQRLIFTNNALDTLNTTTNKFQTDLNAATYTSDAGGRIITQNIANSNLQLAIDSLNTKYGDRYLFSGRASDKQPVNNADLIINGDASHDGLKQIIAERNQADLGIVAALPPAVDAPSTGRLSTAVVGTVTGISEDVAGSAFGFKLGAAVPTSTSSNITFTGPAGPLNNVAFTVGPAQPVVGDNVGFTLTLPDGTTKSLSFTASTSVTGGSNSNSFQIGATLAQTTANLNAAITTALNVTSATSLKAASSSVAATSFFNQTVASPAVRVGTLPATSATGTIAGFAAGAKPTQAFYNGEEQLTASGANVQTIRNSVATRIDAGSNVGVGIQANEAAFVKSLTAFALIATETFNKADPNDQAHYQELARRVADNLGVQTTQTIKDVQVEVSNTASAAKDTLSRLKQRANIYQNIIDSVVIPDTTTLATELTSLQTQLTASYQITDQLSKLTLTNYLR